MYACKHIYVEINPMVSMWGGSVFPTQSPTAPLPQVDELLCLHTITCPAAVLFSANYLLFSGGELNAIKAWTSSTLRLNSHHFERLREATQGVSDSRIRTLAVPPPRSPSDAPLNTFSPQSKNSSYGKIFSSTFSK